jgi:hypothetical protein
MIQYVSITACLLCIQGNIGTLLEHTLKIRSRVLIVDFLIYEVQCTLL